MDINFQIRLIEDADYDKLSAFSCGVDILDDFFRYELKECINKHYLSAYCVLVDNEDIIGVFTLMNDALMIVGETERTDFFDDLKYEAESDIVDFFNRQSSYPAINIGHLGISSSYQNNGIGTAIVDFVAYTFSQYRQAGCQFVTVDALANNRTLRFYTASGFFFQTNQDMYSPTRRMYRILL
ncbi:MAG: GNAT family N-acetyltransferase [Paramuribaculum sp.]|nr:GNAT family N-acetyltransferase [Paramuribaculum sp.]